MEDVDENLNDASSSSSDEEVHMASELTDSQKKALQELKKLIQDGLQNNQLISFVGDQATIWGVPLLGDKRSDIIILKFLKATNFEVLGAYGRINNTLLWRNKLGIESLFGEEDLYRSFFLLKVGLSCQDYLTNFTNFKASRYQRIITQKSSWSPFE